MTEDETKRERSEGRRRSDPAMESEEEMTDRMGPGGRYRIVDDDPDIEPVKTAGAVLEKMMEMVGWEAPPIPARDELSVDEKHGAPLDPRDLTDL